MSARRREPGAVRVRAWALALAALCLTGAAGARESVADSGERAIALSQAALGTRIDDLGFTDSEGRPRRLAEFRGKPVVLSLVFTGCAYACSLGTRHVDRVVREARAALGQDSFSVLSIGFDTPVDTPEAMRGFARRHGVSDPRWHFLSSADAAAMQRLMDQLGFLAQPSPRGFDHTVQLSVLDREGVLYRQVYGETFPTPMLVEPLKDLVLGRPPPEAGWLAQLGNRVRLFCTVYDPRADRYYFDYSLFVGIGIGALFLGAVMAWLWLELRRGRRGAPA